MTFTSKLEWFIELTFLRLVILFWWNCIGQPQSFNLHTGHFLNFHLISWTLYQPSISCSSYRTSISQTHEILAQTLSLLKYNIALRHFTLLIYIHQSSKLITLDNHFMCKYFIVTFSALSKSFHLKHFLPNQLQQICDFLNC